MTEEVWKDIKGFEGIYQVSNMGNVKSLYRWIKTGRGGLQLRGGIIVKPKIDKYGYHCLGLSKNGKQYMFTIHRLVATHFLPNPDNLPQVNHKNENKTDNRVENLEWCDAKYNSNYGTRNKKIRAKQINDKNKSKPIIQYNPDNQIIKIWCNAKEAERQIGICATSIRTICNKLYYHKTAGGFKWKYLYNQLADWLEEIQDEDMTNERVA